MRLLGTALSSRHFLCAVLLTTAFVAGCTGDETPPPVADTSSTAEPTGEEGATEGPTDAATTEEKPVLDFGGSSGATIDNECDDPSPVWVTVAQSVRVNHEARLGEVTVAGDGRLVGDVTIAAVARGADSGSLTVDDQRGYDDDITDRPAWSERLPVQGASVQPGRYVVFAQVEVRPGRRLEGLDFAWFDSNATGSSPLAMPVEVARRCRGDG